VGSEVTRGRGHEFRHLGPQGVDGEVIQPREERSREWRDRDSVEVPIEVTGVDGSSHTCASDSQCLGHRRLENQKFAIVSSEDARE
jgi:hypothetical protein